MSDKRYPAVFPEDEWDGIQKQAAKEQTTVISILRRAVKLYLQVRNDPHYRVIRTLKDGSETEIMFL